MQKWEITGAQQAVNIVAAVMAGQSRPDIEVELRHWLERRDATLPEPHHSLVVEAVAGGCRAVTLASLPADYSPDLSPAEYLFLDGPLAGQAISSSEVHADGDRIDGGVVAVFQATDEAPSYLYSVDAQARCGHPGSLRFVRSQSPHHRTRVPGLHVWPAPGGLRVVAGGV